MARSCSRYSSLIRPERRLRGVVLKIGAVLTATGLLVIHLMRLPLALTAVLETAWLAYSLRQLWQTGGAYRQACQYRLYADGSVEILCANGERRTGACVPGSVIGARLAWLCVREANGRLWSELLAGNARESNEWRRFQVICRHLTPC